jgi:hypothetical protein
MLFRKATLEGIRAGEVTLAFRRWRKPMAREGGTLLTRAGQLDVRSVRKVTLRSISEADARKSGNASRDELLAFLRVREGELYRIEFRLLGEDPRIALRKKAKLTKDELAAILKRLARLDAASSYGKWTRATLRAIAKNPGRRGPDLAASFGRETKPFKIDVRKLKAMGLTESLRVGYRISPRGRVVLRALG